MERWTGKRGKARPLWALLFCLTLPPFLFPLITQPPFFPSFSPLALLHCPLSWLPGSLILYWSAGMSWHIWHSAPRVSPVFSQHSEAKGGKEGKEGEFAPVAFKGCLEVTARGHLFGDGFLHLPPFPLSWTLSFILTFISLIVMWQLGLVNYV